MVRVLSNFISLALLSCPLVASFVHTGKARSPSTKVFGIIDNWQLEKAEQSNLDTPINGRGDKISDIGVDPKEVQVLDIRLLGSDPVEEIRQFTFASGKVVPLHSHDGPTLNVVLEGSVTVNAPADNFSKTYSAGNTYKIEGFTDYGLEVGDEGATIMCIYVWPSCKPA